MHVFVRRRLLAHPEWDLEGWGVPISQADALLTLMGGSAGPAWALSILGFRTSKEELEAVMHFWRYVGHLMGVRPRWYPTSLEEALQLGYVAAVKAAHGAGDDGKELCSAFFDAFRPSAGDGLAGAIEHGIHRAYSRLFVPPWLYRELGLPPVWGWLALPLAAAAPRFLAETVRRRSRRVDGWLDARARRSRRRWFRAHVGDVAAMYQPAERFTR